MIIFQQRNFGEISLSGTIIFTLFFILLFSFSSAQATDNAERLAQCAKIDSDAKRLQCFDELTSREKFVPEDSPVITATKPALPDTEKLSVLTKLWDLDKTHRKHTFALLPHRSTYLLPVAYNSSPNQDYLLSDDPDSKPYHNEVKFQMSFKVKAWEDLFDKDIDLWVAYTQLSFWQLYNTAESSPFRETNYEPEILLNFRTHYKLFGFQGRFINVGFNHQSNGRSGPQSRGWNRIVANVGWEKNDFNLVLKTWLKLPENEDSDQNPSISRYMGYGELWGTYYWNRHKFAVMVRNNLRMGGGNVGAVQLEWAFPLPLSQIDRIKGYVQYFNGYGECLLDYYQSNNRISAGFMLTDW
jgi:phospholipase A1/A2